MAGRGLRRGRWALPAACLLGWPGPARALNNGLGLTPLLGYSTWNAFHDDINETLFKEAADLLVSSGLAAAGYDYINLDDGWATRERRGDNAIEANSTRFPSGIGALADYVHARGLRLGIYSDAGTQTCAKYTASLGYEAKDARRFADWGVDLLKYDNCFAVPQWQQTVQSRYEAMRDALNATGRPILFSMCEWGVSNPWLYASQVANTWRATKDISIAIEATWDAVMQNLDDALGLARFAAPGGFNDLDILEVGKPGGNLLTFEEQQAHFGLWALLKSPLLISTDLKLLTPQTLRLLKSPEVLAINQDPLGVPGDLVWKQGGNEIYAGPLADGSRAVVLFNRHINTDPNFPAQPITLFWEYIGFPMSLQAQVRDVFARRDLGVFKGFVQGNVTAHGVLMLRITPLRRLASVEAWRPWQCDVSLDGPCQADELADSASPAPAPGPADFATRSRAYAAAAAPSLPPGRPSATVRAPAPGPLAAARR